MGSPNHKRIQKPPELSKVFIGWNQTLAFTGHTKVVSQFKIFVRNGHTRLIFFYERVRMLVPKLLTVLVLFYCSLLIHANAQDQGPSVSLVPAESLRFSNLPRGVSHSIRYLSETSTRIQERFPEDAVRWQRQSESFAAEAQQGKDPFTSRKGVILNRGYLSPISTKLQGYAIYTPPDYDPSKTYPLLIMLHGGSSNGNLFLGVVLGNNMNWEQYSGVLWDEYTPRWFPNFIVVAPDGFGHVIYRWMGEEDILAVIDDVTKHYSVDPDRISLGGLSNGGIGAYALGMRHAHRFAMVQAMAGAPSWMQYAGGRPRETERLVMLPYSGLHLIENSINTHSKFYHGTVDPGPMRPAYIKALEAEITRLNITPPPAVRWYEHGHDLLYLVHQHGRAFANWESITRIQQPSHVVLVSGDYRASRQHWLEVTRFSEYPKYARMVGDASPTDAALNNTALQVNITTDNVRAFAIHTRELPQAQTVAIVVNGTSVYEGSLEHLGDEAHFYQKDGTHFVPGFISNSEQGIVKKPGLSGPIMDAYRGRIIHVYGTQAAEDTETLKRTAERASRGWPVWLWNIDQDVVADTALTPEMMQDAHIALYGNTRSNLVLKRMSTLPISATPEALTMGEQKFESRAGVGARFVYPNPEAPHRYLIVQTGTHANAVAKGNNLPDFLGDYVVYDPNKLASRPRLVLPQAPLAEGFFDAQWRLPEPHVAGGDDSGPLFLRQHPPYALPITAAPADPTPPATFAAPSDDPAGKAARIIRRRITRFPNFRAKVPGATWRTMPAWQVQPSQTCLSQLRSEGATFRELDATHYPSIPTPVQVTNMKDIRVRGSMRISCEMALRINRFGATLATLGIKDMRIASSHRTTPSTSFHTMGLALDIAGFDSDTGVLSVLRDFVETPAHYTCEAPAPITPKAKKLLDIACAMASSQLFSSILTPNYNDGHRDHFHIDVRPDDPRLYLK